MKLNAENRNNTILFTGAIFLILVLAIGSRTIYEKQKSKNLMQKNIELNEQFLDSIGKMKLAYESRSAYLLSFLSENLNLSPAHQTLKEALLKLNNLELNDQSDFQKFDRFASYTNELVVREVLLSRKNQFARRGLARSTFSLFLRESDIRLLERYDLAIDNARKNLAEKSWQSNIASIESQKLFFIRPKLNPLPYFEADRMVLRKNL